MTPDSSGATDVPAPKKLLLWPNGAPGVFGSDPADTPTVTLFQPSPRQATGATIILCPGGAYAQHTAAECEPVAQWLNKLGITAILVRYRLGPRHLHPAPLQDVARAVKMTRALAGPWKIDPNRVGILGFSAGGHLASTLCTHFTEGDKSAEDPVDRLSSRPDLSLLIYPLITLRDPHTHVPSRNHLLGENPVPEQLDHLSSDQHVSRRTPPAFLFHTLDNMQISAENAMLYFKALRVQAIPAELHLYESGPHGAGLAPADQRVNTWPTLASRWLASHGFGNGA